MKTVEMQHPPQDTAWIFKEAAEESVCVRFADGSLYVLQHVDEGDVEAAQIAAHKELMKEIFQESERTHSLADVKSMFNLDS